MTIQQDAARTLDAADREDRRAAVWLTVKEYAAQRGIHEQTVYSAIRRGLFPHPTERVGRTIRIGVSRESIRDRRAS